MGILVRGWFERMKDHCLGHTPFEDCKTIDSGAADCAGTPLPPSKTFAWCGTQRSMGPILLNSHGNCSTPAFTGWSRQSPWGRGVVS